MGLGGRGLKKKSSLTQAVCRVPKKRRLKPVQDIAKARVLNRQFKDKAQVSYSGNTKATPDSLPVAAVVQVCFQEVAALTRKGARKWLLKAGVLRPSGHKTCFHCWHCSTARDAGDSKTRSLRCPNSRCKVRARLDDTEYAFTAFSGCAAAGCDLDFVRFMRTAYCLGLKMSNDQTMHVCRLPDENPKSALSYVGTHFRRHKLALAFSEASLSKKSVFRSEVVEADSGSLSSKRTSEGRQHGARLLAVKGRLSKRWTVTALEPSLTKGKRGSAPESAAEVRGPLQAAVLKP